MAIVMVMVVVRCVSATLTSQQINSRALRAARACVCDVCTDLFAVDQLHLHFQAEGESREQRPYVRESKYRLEASACTHIVSINEDKYD